MGNSQSGQVPLVRHPSSEHVKKVGPLLRANHKHQLLLTTTPRQVTRISQSLAAACLLDIQPVSALFDLWDKVALDTIDVTDSEDEIVQVDYLSPEHLGREEQATRYVDYFDDEVVRLLYSYTACAKQYLAVEQVVDGLLARNGWAARQLAYAIEMGSKDMCTEALGGALSFYEPLPIVHRSHELPETEQDIMDARDGLIDRMLACSEVTLADVSELVVLNSICALRSSSMPRLQFAKLWTIQVSKLETIISKLSSSSSPTSSDADSSDDSAWPAIIRDACETQPLYLPELRLLKDHSTRGLTVAQRLFSKP